MAEIFHRSQHSIKVYKNYDNIFCFEGCHTIMKITKSSSLKLKRLFTNICVTRSDSNTYGYPEYFLQLNLPPPAPKMSYLLSGGSNFCNLKSLSTAISWASAILFMPLAAVIISSKDTNFGGDAATPGIINPWEVFCLQEIKQHVSWSLLSRYACIHFLSTVLFLQWRWIQILQCGIPPRQPVR